MQPSECPENSAEAARHVRGATMAWGADAYLDLTRPDDIEVDLVDYAYCLAYTVRWRGQCRFRAPELQVINGQVRTAWPLVREHDWCGEHAVLTEDEECPSESS